MEVGGLQPLTIAKSSPTSPSVRGGGMASSEAGGAVGGFDDEWRVGDVGGDGGDGRVDGGRDG